ncbi:MAG: hypothetical protein JSW04_01030, partial [Desulfobacterales bacterium]
MNQSFKKKLSKTVSTVFILSSIFSLQNCTTSKPHLQTNVIIQQNLENILDSSMGIFDFGHSSQLQGLGTGLAQITKDYLLTKKIIRQIELVGERTGTVDECIKIGSKMGYDLILVGYIGDFFYGGISASSNISISIRIVDVKTKDTLWYAKGHME